MFEPPFEGSLVGGMGEPGGSKKTEGRKRKGAKGTFWQKLCFQPRQSCRLEDQAQVGGERWGGGGRAYRLEQFRPYMEIFTFWLPRPSAAATPPRREKGLLFHMNQLLSCLKGSREMRKEQAAVGLSETESSTAVGPSRPPAPLQAFPLALPSWV